MFLVGAQGETKSLPREALLTISAWAASSRGMLHTHIDM